MPDAVVLDLGNVLIRWDPFPAVEAGVGDDEARRFLAAADFDFWVWNHAQDAGRSWADGESAVAASHPHWLPHLRAYRQHFGRSLTGVIDDSVAVLRDLHAAGVPVYGLTNWSAELFPVARERYDFLGLFDDIVVSGEVGLAKPDRLVFDALAERTGRPLDRCVFADDSPTNIEAATQAGLDAVLFTDAGGLRTDLRSRGLPV